MAAMLYESRGDRGRAKQMYEGIVSRDPAAGVAANNLAWMYAEDGKLDEALRLARIAQEQLKRRPEGEDTLETRFDLAIFAAALEGYAAGAAGLLSAAEIDAILPGLETVCLELAARFCVDVFEDRYFGWSPDRFSSRRQHNLVRAQGQLALAAAVAASRPAARAAVQSAFA